MHRHSIPSILAPLALLACSDNADFSQSKIERGQAAVRSAAGEGVNASVQPPSYSGTDPASSSGADSNTNSDFASGAFSESQAAPPVAISGASLACRPTSETELYACYVPNNSGQATKITNVKTMDFVFVPLEATTVEIPMTFKKLDPVDDGTFFLLSTEGKGQGTVRLNIDSKDLENENYSIDMQAMKASTNPLLLTAPIDQVPIDQNMAVLSLLPGTLIGDGSIVGENDSCLAQAGTSVNPVNSSQTFTLTLQAIVYSANIYLQSLCGLQAMGAVATIKGLTAPFAARSISLMPGGTNLLLFQNLTLPPGTYQFTLDNSKITLPNGGIDDFTADSLGIQGISALVQLQPLFSIQH